MRKNHLSFRLLTWRYRLWAVISFVITWWEDEFTTRCTPRKTNKNTFIMFNQLENRSISNGFPSHIHLLIKCLFKW